MDFVSSRLGLNSIGFWNDEGPEVPAAFSYLDLSQGRSQLLIEISRPRL